MATEAQVEANRANARKSTGPRTPEGKEKASQNSLKHGLFARETVIRGEDEGEFAEYRENLLCQLIPGSPLEEVLADRFVDLSWRLKRAVRDQEAAFGALYEKYLARQAAEEPGNAALLSGNREEANRESGGPGPDSGSGTGLGGAGVPPSSRGLEARATEEANERAGRIGRMILEDFTHAAVLDRLLRYERRIESSMFRALNELRRVYDQRQKAALDEVQTLERWRDEDWEARKARAFARYRPPAVPEEVAGLKCPVSSPPAGASSPGSLVTSDFTLATSGATPAAQDETWKTNPSSEEASSVKCQVLSQASRTLSPESLPASDFPLQASGGTPPAQAEMYGTNPIRHGEADAGPVVRATEATTLARDEAGGA